MNNRMNLINDLMAKELWDDCTAEIAAVRRENEDSWWCWWYEARILRFRDQDPISAYKKISEALTLFGYNFYLLDSGMSYLNLSGNFRELLNFWKSYQNEWKPESTNPAQIAVHLSHAYSQLKRSSEALTEIQRLGLLQSVENDRNLTGPNDIYFYNMSCLYAELGDETQMLHYAQAALGIKDKLSQFRSDDSFSTIRSSPLFQTFIEYNENHFHMYRCFKKGDHQVEFYCHPNSSYPLVIIECQKENYSKKKFEISNSKTPEAHQFPSRSDLLIYLNEFILGLIAEGYQETAYPFFKDWIETLSEIFQSISETRDLPSPGSLVFDLEWDYVYYDLPPEEHPLTRGYYYYGDLGENSDIGTLPIIPTRSIFQKIICHSLEAKSIIPEGSLLSFIHSEHDSGEEYSFDYGTP